MSGILPYTYREGNRCEVLAQYILSALGIVIPVPRTEDIGFDLVCSVADKETGNLSFSSNYVVSVKSFGKGKPEITFEPSQSWDGGIPVHINWVFRSDSPLYIALVDQNSFQLYLYSTSLLWWLLRQPSSVGAITLKPRTDPADQSPLSDFKELRHLKEFPNKIHYEIDLGHPMLVMSIEDTRDNDKLRAIKQKLREDIAQQIISLRHMRMGVMYFYSLAHRTNDTSKGELKYFCAEMDADAKLLPILLRESAPILSLLALHYDRTNQASLAKACSLLLKQTSMEHIPSDIQDKLRAYLASEQ